MSPVGYEGDAKRRSSSTVNKFSSHSQPLFVLKTAESVLSCIQGMVFTLLDGAEFVFEVFSVCVGEPETVVHAAVTWSS